jgi:FixJ family two-component response regulator
VLHGGNGEALAAQTKLPMILISGHPERIEHLKDGPTPFLAKPFSTNRLLFFVQQMLASRLNRMVRLSFYEILDLHQTSPLDTVWYSL